MISVQHEKSGIISSRAELNKFTKSVLIQSLIEVDVADANLAVQYCSEARIRQYNRDFRHIDKSTDVLSFPTAEEFPVDLAKIDHYLGDIAICLPYVARQAIAAGRAIEDEVALMLVHGLLHLLGWDHDTKERKREMWKEQDRLLRMCAHIEKPKLEVRIDND